MDSKLKNIVHPIIKLMMRTTASFYFEEVIIKGHENIPKSGPSILACNHPNSFLDALIITVYYRLPIFYIARGDAFKKPLGAKLLSFLNNVPIFRKEEGGNNFTKNQETFAYCLDVLKKGDNILIFSEGLCENEWYLRPLRKGTARLVYEAWNDPELKDKLKVIPVTTNYSGWFGAGNKTYVEFLEPIEKNDLQGITEQGVFMRKFNEALHHSLLRKTISIDKSKDVKSQNSVSGFMLKNLHHGDEAAKKALKKFHEHDHSAFKEKYHELAKFIQHENLRYYSEEGANIISFIVSLFIIPVAFIFNIIPYSVCKYIAEKTTRRNVFYDSVFFGSLLFLGTIYMTLLTLSSLYILHSWAGLGVPIIALFSASIYETAKRNIYCFYTRKKQTIVATMLKGIYGTHND